MAENMKNNIDVKLQSEKYKIINEIVKEGPIRDARNYIKKYQDETVALSFSNGLLGIKELFKKLEECYGSIDEDRYKLVLHEIEQGIVEINEIVKSALNGKKIKELNEHDIEMVLEIEQIMSKLFNHGTSQMMKNITRFLLETKEG